MKYTYYLIDAFTCEPFEGAQIAVFTQASGLSNRAMQLMARELNLSETVFIQATSDPEIPWHFRIFSPHRELDFAGHPIIAGCYALALDEKIASGTSSIRQNVGVLQVSVEQDENERLLLGFTLPAPVRFDDFVPSSKELAEMLYLDQTDIDVDEYRPMISSCGNDYLIVPVKSQVAMSRARFNEVRWTLSFIATLASQIVLFATSRSEEAVDFNMRLLGKGIADKEDPPVGSAIPAFAAYLFAERPAGVYGATMQRGGGDRRTSILHAELTKTESSISHIKVSGHAVKVGKGEIELPD